MGKGHKIQTIKENTENLLDLQVLNFLCLPAAHAQKLVEF